MPYKDPKKHRDYYREYMRRRRAGIEATPAPDATKDQEIARLKARIRELEAQARKSTANPERHGQVAHGHRQEFTEIGRLKAEIGKLKSDIIKLKRELQEEPDATKLRKKVVDQQVEMASLRHAMKQVAKERDKYQARVKAYQQPKHQEARRLLTGPNYRILIKALHPDRSQHVTAGELAAAERLATGLRPLFDEGT